MKKFWLSAVSLLIVFSLKINAQYQTLTGFNGSGPLFVFPNKTEAKYFILKDSSNNKLLDPNSLSVIRTLPDSLEMSYVYGFNLLPDLNNNGSPEGFFYKENINNPNMRRFYIRDIITDEILYTWTGYLVQFVFLGNFPGDNNLKMVIENYSPGSPSTYYFYDLGVTINPTAINDNATINNFVLQQNFPNPFNPSTTIKYSLPKSSNVEVQIFNSIGQRIKTLVNQFQNNGDHTLQWDGNNDSGQKAASGTYIYQINVDGRLQTKKMMLLK